MNKTTLLSSLNTIKDHFGALESLIDEIYSKEAILKQNNEENVKVRADLINAQKKALLKIKEAKEIETKAQKKQESVDSQRKALEGEDKKLDSKREIVEQEIKKLDEKMAVAENLQKWTTTLEDREIELKSGQAKLQAKQRDFEEEKERVRVQKLSNDNYKIKLDRQSNELKSKENRVNRILGDV